MKTRRLALAPWVGLVLLTASGDVACAPKPSVATASLDLAATLDAYLGRWPADSAAVTPAALNEQLAAGKPFIVDVREAREVAGAGYIAGAINLPIRSLMRNLDKLPAKDQPIVVVCSSGHRSALGMAALQLLGYAHVRNLAGGFLAWQAASLPVAAGKPPEPKAGSPADVDRDLLAALDRSLGRLPNSWNLFSPSSVHEILLTSTPFQLELRDSVELVDGASIAGSTNIPIRALVRNIDKLPPDQGALIIAECDDGQRSAIAMLTLSLLGYTNVKCLAGGVAAWKKAGNRTTGT